MPALALLIGAALGWAARRRELPTLTIALAGLPGPVLLTLAYLIAGPGSGAARYQVVPYWAAMTATGAGVLGSVLAAVAGVLFAVKYPKVEPLMGLLPGIKAFIAAVFGGIGNIAGAVAGAMIIGLVEVMVVGYVENGSQYRDAIAFVLLIGMLLVRPQGLLGRRGG
jgi:hypothetical protein